MQNFFGNNQVSDERVKEACRVILEYMQFRKAEIFPLRFLLR